MDKTHETTLNDEAVALQAQQLNERNAQCAVECGGGAPELLTPEQVRAMTRSEVRDNYALILESMRHWQ